MKGLNHVKPKYLTSIICIKRQLTEWFSHVRFLKFFDCLSLCQRRGECIVSSKKLPFFVRYCTWLGWSTSSFKCHSKLPAATKNYQTDYPPATYWPYMVNFKRHLYFLVRVAVRVAIIKLKANLSSTGTGLANWNWAWQKLTTYPK